MKLTTEQETILSTVPDLTRAFSSTLIEARAGSGKTFILTELAPLLPAGGQCLAFNRAIADELRAKLPEKCPAATFHSLGFSLLRERLRVKSDPRKLYKLAKEKLKLAFPRPYQDLVSAIKINGLGLANMPPLDVPTLSQLIDLRNIELPNGVSEEQFIKDAIRLFKRSLTMIDSIDFDDMLYLPLFLADKYKWKFDQFPFLMIDEAQDVSPLRLEMIKRLTKTVIAVGDPYQCHPAGTQIKTPHGYLNIENVEEGDDIYGYSANDACMRKTKVTATHAEPFIGELIELSSTSLSHKVTPNHRCYVKMDFTEKAYALYLMKKGGQVRIGVARLWYKESCGVTQRARQEGAEAVWILTLLPDEKQALCFEKAYGAIFGISDMMFSSNGSCSTPQYLLDAAWSIIGDSTERMQAALTHFKRDPRFPIWEKGQKGQTLTTRGFVTQACNLLETHMHVRTEKSWEPLSIAYQQFEGTVYGISVDGLDSRIPDRRLYLANGIVTHNSIYAFAGAISGALQTIESHYNTERFPLSYSFRCPSALTAHAGGLIAPDQILSLPENNGGSVETTPWNRDWYPVSDAQVVLCRMNQPLFVMALKMLRMNQPVNFNSDFPRQLISFMKRFKAKSSLELQTRLTGWYEEQVERFNAGSIKKGALLLAQEKHDTLMYLSTQCEDAATVIITLETLLTPRPGHPTLSTIHKSKGLEWKSVYLLRPDLLPAPFANSPEELEQERNLHYVAVTRSSDTFTYLEK